MKQPGSNFVSWVGLALLAALVLVAAYFDLVALESFLIIILLLCLAAFLWGRLSLRKIDVEAEYEESCGFPGQTLELPEPPTREGYTFTGWYKDFGCYDPWNVETDTVETDMTLYAGWEKIQQ